MTKPDVAKLELNQWSVNALLLLSAFAFPV